MVIVPLAKTPAPLTKISSRITVDNFEIKRTMFGYKTTVAFGVHTVYVEMGAWSSLRSEEFSALTHKGLLRKVEASRARRHAIYADR